ncbi:MAG TPA: hypothetical protein VNG51_20780 [Ktedonobacteraceae bacterium]|nr:hypothetical protein [Ktedonobacteraceae bacterium]
MKLPFLVKVEPKTRFPLVVVPETNYALAWLPVTKIQIEYFLCETMDSQFDRRWYLERLKHSPRVTTEELTIDTIRQTFMTHLLFHEARTLSGWWGRDTDLPTLAEWRKALDIFDQVAAHDDFVEEVAAMPGLHPHARFLLRRVEQILSSRSYSHTAQTRLFSHQLLMRSGILEYVYKDEHRDSCVACGSLQRFSERVRPFEESFITQLRSADTGERIQHLGFRLIVRNPV